MSDHNARNVTGPEMGTIMACHDNLLCVKRIPLDAMRGLDQHVHMLITIFIWL
jgi:hypothetical protein